MDVPLQDRIQVINALVETNEKHLLKFGIVDFCPKCLYARTFYNKKCHICSLPACEKCTTIDWCIKCCEPVCDSCRRSCCYLCNKCWPSIKCDICGIQGCNCNMLVCYGCNKQVCKNHWIECPDKIADHRGHHCLPKCGICNRSTCQDLKECLIGHGCEYKKSCNNCLVKHKETVRNKLKERNPDYDLIRSAYL